MSDCPGGQEAGYQVECRGEWCCVLAELKLTSLGNGILHLVRMSINEPTVAIRACPEPTKPRRSGPGTMLASGKITLWDIHTI